MKTTTSLASSSCFPTIGESVLQHVMNVSGQRSPYTKTMAKKTQGRGASPTGRAAVRGRSLISEANGPQFHISAKLYEQNAACASETYANTRLMKVAVPREDRVGSASDFWTKRQFGQRLQ